MFTCGNCSLHRKEQETVWCRQCPSRETLANLSVGLPRGCGRSLPTRAQVASTSRDRTGRQQHPENVVTAAQSVPVRRLTEHTESTKHHVLTGMKSCFFLFLEWPSAVGICRFPPFPLRSWCFVPPLQLGRQRRRCAAWLHQVRGDHYQQDVSVSEIHSRITLQGGLLLGIKSDYTTGRASQRISCESCITRWVCCMRLHCN